ncbi:hypothetical protein ACET3Z_018285 [Daucus carota]
MRFKAEQSHNANNGLENAVQLLEPIKEQFPIISYGALYQVLNQTVTALAQHAMILASLEGMALHSISMERVISISA